MLHFTALAPETQVHVGEAASPGPSSLVPATGLSYSCSHVSSHAAAGLLGSSLHLPGASPVDSGRKEAALEPRPGWAGLERVLGLTHGCCLPLAM